jgi:hypothetical protein
MLGKTLKFSSLAFLSGMLLAGTVLAGPVYQPPGANLTLGDVTHGKRILSASSNPAAAAADRARASGKPVRGTVISASAGLEYGNVQNLFDRARIRTTSPTTASISVTSSTRSTRT